MDSPIPQKGNEIKIEEEGVIIRARFDNRDILEKALIIDENWDIKIKITRYLDEVTISIKWKDFAIKFKEGFGINLPGFLYKSMFLTLSKTPLEHLKGLLSVIEELVQKEYWKAQEIYEENYNK